uniref:GCN5-related N-acetyltransferase n=1 Tax=uncultured Chloroflexota bacterium TaxID=166587 RepID=H5SPD3_9CHLR|nr:GCN5-related N-acetyltransferase [uncultured Chloroflexota bacterium]
MIKGRRISLRAIERGDLPRFVTWLNDPEVIAHLTIFLPLNLDDETDWYEQQRRDPATQTFAIVEEQGTLIGSIGLHQIDYRQQKAELGILIGDKSRWGQGYCQEAIRLLLNFAFTHMNLHRIYLHVEADHHQAINCYLKCGFIEEGRLRQAIYRQGRFQDLLIMSVLRSEYLQ